MTEICFQSAGEKPYACAVCPRAFNQRVVLREHIRSHHSGPDPNYSHSMTPYCCSVCSDMFATSQDLIVHLIHHCDLNTAMRRQPQVGPRKYKRRRKLKPHELEILSNNVEEVDDEGDDDFTESDDEKEQKKKAVRKPKKSPAPKSNIDESYAEVYNSFSSTLETLNSIMNPKTSGKAKKKTKAEPVVPSRPKMIHTQKTKVAVETGEGGKIRHKTKTMVTRTQPTELKSATGERIRPRTKNVSYHVLHPDKLPLATFPDDDVAQAVSNLLASEPGHSQTNGDDNEVAEEPSTDSVKVENTPSKKKPNNSLTPGRHIIGPGTKVVRIVKGGMIVSKNKKKEEVPVVGTQSLDQSESTSTATTQSETDNLVPEVEQKVIVKQEIVDPSPLHELAEISMQHAQSMFKCEMCSEVFSDRSQLLVHVPIHI